jgi:hypothetical protein
MLAFEVGFLRFLKGEGNQPDVAFAKAFGIAVGRGKPTIWSEAIPDSRPYEIGGLVLAEASRLKREGQVVLEKALISKAKEEYEKKRHSDPRMHGPKLISEASTRRAWKAYRQKDPGMAAWVDHLISENR